LPVPPASSAGFFGKKETFFERKTIVLKNPAETAHELCKTENNQLLCCEKSEKTGGNLTKL